MSMHHLGMPHNDTAGEPVSEQHTLLSHLQKKWLWSWWLCPVYNVLTVPPGGRIKHPQHKQTSHGCSVAFTSLCYGHFPPEQELYGQGYIVPVILQ